MTDERAKRIYKFYKRSIEETNEFRASVMTKRFFNLDGHSLGRVKGGMYELFRDDDIIILFNMPEVQGVL